MDFSNFRTITIKRIMQYSAIFLNIFAFLFAAVYGAVRDSSSAANAFAVIVAIIFFLDVVYCALSKFKFHLLTIAAAAILILLNLLGELLLSVSASGFSAAMLALIPVVFIAALVVEISTENKSFSSKIWNVLIIAFKIAAPILLLVLAFLGFDSYYNFGYTPNEYTTTRAGFAFLFIAFSVLAALIKVYIVEPKGKFLDKIAKNAAHMIICVAMGAFTVFAFVSPLAMIPTDIKNAEKACLESFGAEFEEVSGERKAGFNFADKLFGIKIDGYTTEKDIEYSSANGLSLKYDAYIPTAADAHKSVLINIHGRGGDKGNSVEKCRYFASQGYVVCDLQVGDFKEKGINYNTGVKTPYKDMKANIADFFRYSAKNSKHGANWDSVFISGGSMGGGLTLYFMYGDEDAVDISSLGITIKGILPIYPSYNPTYDSDERFSSVAVPCLTLMGTHDGEVDTYIATDTEEKYLKNNRNDCATVWISLAGHGCDGVFSDRASQIFIYFAERFMAYYR